MKKIETVEFWIERRYTNVGGDANVPVKIFLPKYCPSCNTELKPTYEPSFGGFSYFKEICDHFKYYSDCWNARVIDDDKNSDDCYMTANCKRCGFNNPYATSTDYTCTGCKILWG